MYAYDLYDLISYRVHRIQCGEGILKDHGNFFSSYPAKLFFLHLKQILPQINGLSALPFGGNRIQQSHQAAHNRAFSTSGFSYDSDNFTRINIKIHSIHCRNYVLSRVVIAF